MTADSERPRLREYRLQLGWTQQEMAERLAQLAWMLYREHVAVNADMIAKWERGVKGVSPRYRELLCRLFGATPEQLGLKTTPSPAPARGVAAGEDESLVAMLDNAAHLLGVPPRFRTPDPIRSGPERRGANARTTQEVHT